MLDHMPYYEIFGRFYDAVMGDRSRQAEHLSELIRAANPDAREVLELGCGTGSMLAHLQNRYEVSGLDISNRMLSIARQKVPKAKLFRMDMVDFRIDRKFDVIFCVFDSINHVVRFADWKKLFRSVSRHLSPGGCFIFDINTQLKLERLMAERPWIHPFGENLLIMTVTPLPRYGSNWIIKVFEQTNRKRYVLHEENIAEVTFPVEQIVAALRPGFTRVRVIDPDRKQPSARSERLFFVAKKG